jgi:uncharacterized protein (DUF433 family)
MPEQTIFPPTVVRTNRGLTVAGTRITLYSIMDYVKTGRPPEVIRDAFKLTIKQTRDVLEYIQTHKEEVEAEYQQVLAEVEQERRYWEERNRERFASLQKTSPTPGQEAVRAKLHTLNLQGRGS